MTACEKTEPAVDEGLAVESEGISAEEERSGRTRRDPRTKSIATCHSTEILKIVSLQSFPWGGWLLLGSWVRV